MDIKRTVFKQIKNALQPNKAVLLYGPRQVGKTYLLEKLIPKLEKKEKIKFVSGENRIVQQNLSVQITEKLKKYVGNHTLLIVDEAHKIPKIGINLKLIVDHIPKIKVIATGSASFDLAQKVGEPLAGRKKTIRLYPVSVKEIIQTFDIDYHQSLLEEQLIFGNYPEIFKQKSSQNKISYLDDLIDSYLLKDILELENLKKPKKIIDLLRLLAFQIGKKVSISKLGNNLDLHKNTVAKYLDILEKIFVLINIRGFSRNLRKEIVKNSRYYFYDNGVRNGLINNFNPLNLRNDVRQLWENFLVIERLKKQAYKPIFAGNYFWQTYDQKEIDWVEMRKGKLFGYEIRWGNNKKSKAKKEWLETYKGEAKFKIINQENYLKFIL